MDAIPGSAGRWTPRVVNDTCVLWTFCLEHEEEAWLYEHMLARNYVIRASTEDREALWRLLPLCKVIAVRDLAGLVDTLADCIDLADRMRAFGVELIHCRPKGPEPTAYDVQHGRVLSLIRSLARVAHITEPGDALRRYWRDVLGRR